MNRRLFLKLAGVSALTAAAPAFPASQKQTNRPNIIIIMSDDQGRAQFGFQAGSFTADKLSDYSYERAFYGKEPYDPQKALKAAAKCTPNIDRLRQNGMLLTNFHVAPSCAPTRATMLTSKYPQSWGGYTNRDFEISGMGEEESPVKHLQKAGYATACIGKWHSAPLEKQHPLDYGFDYFFGFGRSWTTYHNSPHLVRNRQKAQPQGYLTEQLTDEALSFISQSTEAEKPFMLYLPYNAPHSPTDTTPEKYHKLFDTGSLVMNKVYGAIYAMDLCVAKIIEKLERENILDNTLIFFTVDNGCPYWFPLPGNGEMKGFKRQLFEGSTRTPLIAFWKDKIEKGSQSDELLSCMDILPTALEAASVPQPKDIDGISIMPVITAKGKWDSGRVLFWAGSHGQGTEEARMFMAERAKNEGHFTDWFTPAGWYVIKDRWKLLSPGTGTLKLYDIKNDPGENTDLASKYPQTVKEMSILFNEWLKDKPGPTGWDRSKWKLMKQLAEKYAALPGSDT